MAGALLSFGNLLSEIVSAGSPGLTTSNPGLVKLLAGFVFPIGLVMFVLILLFISIRFVHFEASHMQDCPEWPRTPYK
jgi:formate/nitrite transporter FocA (FNT family)